MTAADWTAHYDSIYSTVGITATLTPNDDSGEVEITVVDATARPGVEAGGILIQTISPRVCVRTSELDSFSIDRAQLRGGTLVVGDYTWRIGPTEPRPGPLGKGSGEILLVLMEPD